MEIIPVKKEIMLFDGSKLKIDTEVKLSKSITINEKDYEFGVNMLIEQYLRSVKSAIESYKNSNLPSLFIRGQEYIVTDVSYLSIDNYHRILGVYNLLYDQILFDPDSISGIGINPNFLMGHEVGHKISKYKLDDASREEIRSILGIPCMNEHIIEETFADACGDIVQNEIINNNYSFMPDDLIRREKMRIIALRTSYKC